MSLTFTSQFGRSLKVQCFKKVSLTLPKGLQIDVFLGPKLAFSLLLLLLTTSMPTTSRNENEYYLVEVFTCGYRLGLRKLLGYNCCVPLFLPDLTAVQSNVNSSMALGFFLQACANKLIKRCIFFPR